LILSGHSDLWKWRCKGDISVCDIRVVRFHALTVPLIGDGFGVRRDGPGAAVDGHQLSWMQAYRGVAGGDDGGDSVFAGHPGGVRSEAATVGVLGTDIVLLTLGITGLAPTRSSSALATSPWGYSRTPSCSRRR
jgi:hypothetical protein